MAAGKRNDRRLGNSSSWVGTLLRSDDVCFAPKAAHVDLPNLSGGDRASSGFEGVRLAPRSIERCLLMAPRRAKAAFQNARDIEDLRRELPNAAPDRLE